MEKPKPLDLLSPSLRDEKLDMANEILSDLDKSSKLGHPAPYDLANNFLHNLKILQTFDHDTNQFKKVLNYIS